VAVGAVCFRSGMTVPVGLVDVNEGEICAAKNYVVGGIESKTLGSGIMLDDTSSVSPIIKHR
jgi:hypothetical protein